MDRRNAHHRLVDSRWTLGMLAVAAALTLTATTGSAAGPEPSTSSSSASSASTASPRIATGFEWAALLVAGDNSIAVFDQGVDAVGGQLQARGVNIVAVLRASDGSATRSGLASAMGQLAATGADGCVVYMTSHGTDVGFLLSLEGTALLQPTELDALVDAGCGTKPTVLIVSACHSGTFVTAMEAPNRIVITAARADRSSFGCSPDVTYTFFDGCVLSTLPTVMGWEQLFTGADQCVVQQEQNLGYTPSEPQLSVGSMMVNAALPVP